MIAHATTNMAIKRILIIKPSSLGDVITATPLLRGLRRRFPDAHLGWLLDARFADVIAHDDDLDEALIYKRSWLTQPALLAALISRLRRKRFDWVIDLQGLMRSSLLTFCSGAELRAGLDGPRESFARLGYNHRVRLSSTHVVDRSIEFALSLGIDATADDFTLRVSDRGRDFADRLLRRLGAENGGFVATVPPTRWPTKQYPAYRWRQVVANLATRRPVVLLGSPTKSERELCAAIARDQSPAVIDLCGETSVDEMVGVITASAAVACADSAAQYIAPAVGVPVVSIAGPTLPRRTGPYRLGRTIAADVPCSGCLRRRCSHITCMRLIEPRRVVEAVESALSERVIS